MQDFLGQEVRAMDYVLVAEQKEFGLWQVRSIDNDDTTCKIRIVRPDRGATFQIDGMEMCASFEFMAERSAKISDELAAIQLYQR